MSRSLTPSERERLEGLFDLAAELPVAERAAFVERECGSNEALRGALLHLLEGLAGEDILSQIQPGAPTREGTRIGPYKLLERIGEGGMGEVYAAEQLEPVLRRVALKIIKPGMDSAQVVARFEAERQALARMTHPNIARVYDGGTTGEGRPYFVMEYVAGLPVTDYCDRRKLSTRERLELFLAICDGVQHAHQKGIIHRDLKPSNLLVATEEGRALPKIIDFGVARATTGRLTERTLHTMLGQIVGTLDYMSPEQADPTGVDIDTRSDVYSLGVVLYQLLSGFLPFEHRSAVDVPLSEIQRTIREKDPPTPSTRLRREKGTATALAPLHGTSERALIRQLSGDLDWICMKALEKDPTRRYASAAELAADVRRHLADEPVLAGPPGALYRTRKFVRRHRAGVTTGVLVVAALASGAAGITSGRMKALAAEERRSALEPQGDDFLAGRLLAEVEELWPVTVASVPRLERWIEQAREVSAKLPRYRSDLEDLRARAQPWTAEEQARDRSGTPGIEWLEAMEAELATLPGLIDAASEESKRANLENQARELEASIARLRADASVRRTWSFAADLDQSSHEVLAELISRLEELGDDTSGLLAADGVTVEHGWSVPKRLALARKLEQGFAPDGAYAQAWRRALPLIRAAYPGLELGVQSGLVPIGPDPDSKLWEFAHLPSGEPAERGADGKLVVKAETGIVLVLIPSGSFLMGSQDRDPAKPNYYSGPRNVRALRESGPGGNPLAVDDVPAYFVSKYEMTQGQWARATGENPSNQQLRDGLPLDDLNPVNFVSWVDCDRTMRRLGLCLPSEEQWEYATRATTDWPWWTGPEAVSLNGAENVFDRSSAEAFPGWAQQQKIQPAPWDDGSPTMDHVGRLRANPWGLHDTGGNVVEWCANPPYFYGTVPGSAQETRRLRTARGGSARTPPEECRSAVRLNAPMTFADPSLGLRPARILE